MMDPLDVVDPTMLGTIEVHRVLVKGGMGKVCFGVNPDATTWRSKPYGTKSFFLRDGAMGRFAREAQAP